MSYRNIKVEQSKIIPEIKIIKPDIYWDLRGNIFTSYEQEIYRTLLDLDLSFIHDKFALSKQNVLRGLHGDNKTWKLVSCVYGEIYEVVVDMRPDSPTYKKWDAFHLKAEEYSQVLIPPNFVNGYFVISKEALFHYKLAYQGGYIDADKQITVKWDDPELGIKWPCKKPVLQQRDA